MSCARLHFQLPRVTDVQQAHPYFVCLHTSRQLLYLTFPPGQRRNMQSRWHWCARILTPESHDRSHVHSFFGQNTHSKSSPFRLYPRRCHFVPAPSQNVKRILLRASSTGLAINIHPKALCFLRAPTCALLFASMQHFFSRATIFLCSQQTNVVFKANLKSSTYQSRPVVDIKGELVVHHAQCIIERSTRIFSTLPHKKKK